MECTYISGHLLKQVASVVQAMCELAQAPVKDAEFPWVMRQYLAEIIDAFERHILPPAGIGSRHGSTKHKTHAWLHAHRLENNGWKAFDATQAAAQKPNTWFPGSGANWYPGECRSKLIWAHRETGLPRKPGYHVLGYGVAA